ncbi:GLIPR1-like protein 1 [Dysidea avara]|uniref:GLIPR1-like protein 1 n=1 Tax=Dysidea avara TaxID=196820 RepID=UPI003332C365
MVSSVTAVECLLLLIAVHQCVSQLTSQQKRLLLDLHNQARSNVTPIATNMEKMEWNDELAAVAQAYSALCIFDHNPNRASQAPSFSSVGENLAISSGRGEDYQFLFTLWHNEHRNYDYNTGTCSGVCGHYTQVVWARSNQLGCGVTLCTTVEGFSGTNAVNLVCNYGPAGNFIRRPPYLTGDLSCSNCPYDKQYCMNNLCSDVPAGCDADSVTVDGVSVAGGTASVEFSSDPNAKFRCKLNTRRYRRFRRCTSPLTYTGLSRGRYRVTIQAACPGQRFQDGSSKRVRFSVRT